MSGQRGTCATTWPAVHSMLVRRFVQRSAILTAALVALFTIPGLARQPQDAPLPGAAARFAAVHVSIDTGGAPLGAYQLDLHAAEGDVSIVGVEGATESPAAASPGFSRPPYYDPRAMMSDRVVIGAFSTENLPPQEAGPIRIATIHVRIAGQIAPRFETQLIVAADADGNRIEATVTTELVHGGGS